MNGPLSHAPESVASKDGNKYRILRITLEAHCSSITPNLWHSCESESPARTSLLHVSQDTITSQRRRCVRSGAGCTEPGTKFTASSQHGH
eukprot:Em0016g415a